MGVPVRVDQSVERFALDALYMLSWAQGRTDHHPNTSMVLIFSSTVAYCLLYYLVCWPAVIAFADSAPCFPPCLPAYTPSSLAMYLPTSRELHLSPTQGSQSKCPKVVNSGVLEGAPMGDSQFRHQPRLPRRHSRRVDKGVDLSPG